MDNHQAIMQSTRTIIRTMVFLLAACALLFSGCGQAAEDYRVIEREYVPASELPGIDHIDLEQVSYPVLVGSVAIAEQFPDLVWPDMVNEERWRLRLPPELKAELLYPRDCLFVSPASNGIGTVRKLIESEVIFFRIHRGAGIEPGRCSEGAGSTPDHRCYRITALSESSGMCKDSIKVSRAASFEVIVGEDGARIFYVDNDFISVRNVSIRNGCPLYSEQSEQVVRVGNFTEHIRTHKSVEDTVDIAWVEKPERGISEGLRYARYHDNEVTKKGLVSRYVPSGRSVGYIGSERMLYLHWASSRFSTRFLLQANNPSKLTVANVLKVDGYSSGHVVLNVPRDETDNAFPPIVFGAPDFGVNLFWRSQAGGSSSGSAIQSASMNREMTKLRISDSPIPSREFERRLLGRMTEYHRRLGRGADGPLPPLQCKRGTIDSSAESAPAVLMPGGGIKVIGRGDVDSESREDDGG